MKQTIHKELMNYTEKWVAITLNYSEVVAGGDSIGEVEEKLKSMNYDLDSVIITYVTPPDKFLSPNAYAKT